VPHEKERNRFGLAQVPLRASFIWFLSAARKHHKRKEGKKRQREEGKGGQPWVERRRSGRRKEKAFSKCFKLHRDSASSCRKKKAVSASTFLFCPFFIFYFLFSFFSFRFFFFLVPIADKIINTASHLASRTSTSFINGLTRALRFRPLGLIGPRMPFSYLRPSRLFSTSRPRFVSKVFSSYAILEGKLKQRGFSPGNFSFGPTYSFALSSQLARLSVGGPFHERERRIRRIAENAGIEFFVSR